MTGAEDMLLLLLGYLHCFSSEPQISFIFTSVFIEIVLPGDTGPGKPEPEEMFETLKMLIIRIVRKYFRFKTTLKERMVRVIVVKVRQDKNLSSSRAELE